MIRFENVVKKFGDHVVLDHLSFRVQDGEILFVLGTSGTGKSVLLKCIVGLLRTDEGRLFVDNDDVSQISEERYFPVRRKCGLVFQQPALFDSLSVFENIAFGLRRQAKLSETAIAEHVARCLALVGLANIGEQRPSEISFGMQKRVSLARTLALEPRILLFDEPTTGLDPITTHAINRLIFDLSRHLRTTSIVVSHDINGALAWADRILVLDRGQITAEGTPDEIRRSSNELVREFLAEVSA